MTSMHSYDSSIIVERSETQLTLIWYKIGIILIDSYLYLGNSEPNSYHIHSYQTFF